MGRQIKVTISPLGKPVVEAEGFNGQGCAAATKPIEDALSGAGGVNDRVMKPEWHNVADAGNEQHEQNW
jgi:hypothetical protein